MSNRAERRAAKRLAQKEKTAAAFNPSRINVANNTVTDAMTNNIPSTNLFQQEADLSSLNNFSHAFTATAAASGATTTSHTTTAREFTGSHSPRSISDAQREANRANAQHSTGPKTEAGRAASSQNRTVHGLARHNGFFQITDSEDYEEFQELLFGLIVEHNPSTITEGILVRAMAESHWLAQRALSLQSMYMNERTGAVEDEKKYNLYGRYHTKHKREFHKSLNDLLKLRKENRQAEKAKNGFEAQNHRTDSQDLGSKRNAPSPSTQESRPNAENPAPPNEKTGFEAQKQSKPSAAA